ncbi:MAG: pyridoxamine 5'-phosphate oxidase family protein [Melioribacteraceae bacterium]|nr:pyridoxamine 5'-phosphate oxidase family protein [Melioribacteraceae bacterium]
MRRNEKEITDRLEIDAVIKRATICRIAMVDGNKPYIVPVNYGYKDNTLYIHSAHKGKKIDILKKNNHVCFEIDINTEIVKADKACNWSMKYKSVVGFGKAIFVEEQSEKKKAFTVLMNQYSNDIYEFNEEAVNTSTIIKIEIEDVTGKQA